MSFEKWLVTEIVASKIVTAIQLNKALQIQNDENQALINVLIEYAYITEEQAQWLTDQFNNLEDTTAIFPQKKDTPIYNTKSETTLCEPLKRYSILELLGEGSFGKVYLALDSQTEKKIALKIFSPENTGDGNHLARFQREIKAIAQLVHPNIVNVYDVGTAENKIYFTMKYISGTTLNKTIAEKTLIAPRQAAEIVLQIARALDYAHTNNIIHRDIKPENIIVDENNIACVMDFGLAKEISGGQKVTQTGNILGTPAYMSPEQASGKNKTLDGRTDIYSLGATFYHMLTGRHVFKGGNAVETMQKIIAQLPIPPCDLVAEIPEELENICLKALYKDKNKRYQSAADMAEELEIFVTGKKAKKTRFSLGNFFKK